MHRETRRRRVRPNSFSSDWILPRSSGRNSIRSATGTSSRHANGWSSSRRPKPRSLSLPGSSTKDAPWHFSPGCLSGGRCPDYRQPLPRLGDRIPRVQPPGGDLEPCRRRGIGRLRIRSARLPAPRVSRPPPGGHRCRWPRIHRAAEEDVRARADEARGRDLGRVQVDVSNGDPEGAKVRRHR